MIEVLNYRSPIGTLQIRFDQYSLISIDRSKKKVQNHHSKSPFSQKIIQQLDDYFLGKNKSFDLPLHSQGTLFQNNVWNALKTIPFGETRTYQQIATQIRSPQAARAVGGACNRNPWIIVVPCHRVIGSSGKLIGYAGGLSTKKILLQREKNIAQSFATPPMLE